MDRADRERARDLTAVRGARQHARARARADAPPPAFGGGSWTIFRFEEVGSTFTIPTFTAPAGGARVRIVDVLLKGDQFELLEGAVKLGATSVVPPSDVNTTSDPDVAWGDPAYSRGTFFVGPGVRSLTIRTRVSPFDLGDAFYRVDVPG